MGGRVEVEVGGPGADGGDGLGERRDRSGRGEVGGRQRPRHRARTGDERQDDPPATPAAPVWMWAAFTVPDSPLYVTR